MKRKTLILTAALVLLAFVPFALSAEYWASKNSDKYHYPSCQWAKRVKQSNLVIFKTPEEAKEAGYVPCKVCRPPSTSKDKSAK